MRKLILFLSIVVASAAIAENFEGEPWAPSERSAPRPEVLALEPARQVPVASTLNPNEEYLFIMRVIRTSDGEEIRTYVPVATTSALIAYGDATFGAGSQERFLCRAVAD